jgi:predicted small secreted protein
LQKQAGRDGKNPSLLDTRYDRRSGRQEGEMMRNVLIRVFALTLVCLLPLAACEKAEESTESAGEMMEEAAEKIEDAAEAAGEMIEEGAEKVEDAAEAAGEMIEEGAEKVEDAAEAAGEMIEEGKEAVKKATDSEGDG